MTTSQPTKLEECKLLYSEGAGDIEIAELLGLTMPKFNELLEDHESFRNFVEAGRVAAQAWWYRQGRTNLKNKNFLHALWKYNMANRYAWSDRTETTGAEAYLDADQIRTQLGMALKELNKKDPELARSLQLKAVG